MSGQAPDEFDHTLRGPANRDTTQGPDIGATVPNERPVIDGRYRVIRRIGSGGMGDVYLAEDKDLIDNVAVKLLPSVIGTRKREVERLRQEAKLCRNLTHTNIVSTFTFGLDESRNNSPYLVMQYIDGETLDDVLADFPKGIPLERCCRWIEEIASALDYAHESGILHRDIKPSNIMIDKSGRAYLMDFGIARQAHDTMLEVTGRDASGTPKYMSPQQLAGKNSTSNDIYSFAATVYEMLTGAAPFNSGDITYQIREVPPKPAEHLPGHVNDAMMAGLSKDPIQRPGTATELAQRIAFDPDTEVAESAGTSIGALLPVPRRGGSGTKRTRSASRSRQKTGSRSRTGTTDPVVISSYHEEEAPGEAIAPALAASALWALLAAAGVMGVVMATAGVMQRDLDLAGLLMRPLVIGGLVIGAALGLGVGVVGRSLQQAGTARMVVGAAAAVTALVVLVTTLTSAGTSGVSIAVLLLLSMGTVALSAATLPDIWRRTGLALLAGVVLAGVAALAGLATGEGTVLMTTVAPGLTALVLCGIGAASAGGRSGVQAGLTGGLAGGVIVGLLAFAAVTAAQSSLHLGGALVGGLVGAGLAVVGGVFSGFIARYWNPLSD